MVRSRTGAVGVWVCTHVSNPLYISLPRLCAVSMWNSTDNLQEYSYVEMTRTSRSQPNLSHNRMMCEPLSCYCSLWCTIENVRSDFIPGGAYSYLEKVKIWQKGSKKLTYYRTQRKWNRTFHELNKNTLTCFLRFCRRDTQWESADRSRVLSPHHDLGKMMMTFEI